MSSESKLKNKAERFCNDELRSAENTANSRSQAYGLFSVLLSSPHDQGFKSKILSIQTDSQLPYSIDFDDLINEFKQQDEGGGRKEGGAEKGQEEKRKKMIEDTPLKRIGKPEEAARVRKIVAEQKKVDQTAHPNDAAVPGPEGSASRCSFVLPDGGFLRAFLR